MYLPVRFPLIFATGPVGGPGFSTRLASTKSGFEQRNQDWAASRWSCDASIGVKNDAQFTLVGDHFRMARGRLHHFRVKDFADFKAQRGSGFLRQLTTATFQLFKVYGSDPDFQEFRKITRVAGGLQIWKDGFLLVPVTDYVIDVETGIVTFASAPGASVLECAFQFDVPVRYDTDSLQAALIVSAQGLGAFHSWEQIPMVERRE